MVRYKKVVCEVTVTGTLPASDGRQTHLWKKKTLFK